LTIHDTIEFCSTPLLHSGKNQPSLPSSTRANRLISVSLLAYLPVVEIWSFELRPPF
jgi:hypothetical protein